MLIGFEASALQGQKSGVGYYTENLLGAIARVAPQHNYVLFSNREVKGIYPQDGSLRAHRRHAFPVRNIWMQSSLPLALRQTHPDVCHYPNYLAPLISGCPSVVTIHDMTLFITPRLHSFKKLALDRTLIPHVARKAAAIITVSNSARHDIVRFLKVPKGKVRVIPNAVSPMFRPVCDAAQLEATRRRYGLREPFILYVGTIEPRKNIARLAQAFAQLKRRGLPHKLALVGQPGWHVGPIFAEIERLGIKRDTLFTGYVPAEDLPALYSLAETMAFPSIYEGFGLPVLEAMACGAPVVTSRSSSLAEVAGDAALLVNPFCVDELADALYRLHKEPDLRAELRERGLNRAALFTWESAARATVDLYEQVAYQSLEAPDQGLLVASRRSNL